MKGGARTWIVTFGGAGLVPGAPGTAGMRNGVPVDVSLNIEVNFNLR